MSDYIVDESRFMIPEEHEIVSWFEEGSTLPDGVVFSERLEETDIWQLYVSEDSRFEILAVVPAVAERWLSEGLIAADGLQKVDHRGRSYYLLFSPSQLTLCRVSQMRARGSLRRALGFLAAVKHTRALNQDVNLRDGLYCELFSVILPVYSRIPMVADKALFLNLLRGEHDPEILSSPEELPGGLAWFGVRSMLRGHGIAVPDTDLYFESGEEVDDFLELRRPGAVVLAPLVIHEHYQIFDTDSAELILLFDKLWGEALLATTLVSQINLSSVAVDGRMLYGLAFPRREILETLDDRVYGLDAHSLLKLAQALRRTRAACPGCRLTDALYVESLGVCLPEAFLSENSPDDAGLMRAIAWEGPFAVAPILDDIREDAVLIASR